MSAPLRILDDRGADAVARLCEAIVPGSGRVGPVLYVDALLARMDDGGRAAALAAIEALDPADLATHAGTPDFLLVRALVIEAYYSDFVAPGLDTHGAYAEIDFNSPLAERVRKDWSYLGIVA
jgi:hypothetical protein